MLWETMKNDDIDRKNIEVLHSSFISFDITKINLKNSIVSTITSVYNV